MKVMMTGSSGFVGSRLKAQLEEMGHEVIGLSHEDLRPVEGCGALINLMGVNIACRWNEKNKRAIYESRVEGTKKLVERLHELKDPPKLLLSASAVGIYGDGFLKHVAEDWEKEACSYQKGRVIRMRFGTILDPRGGALKKMLLPFKLCLGGRLGSGEQRLSWVTLDDLVRNIIELLSSKDRVGSVDLVSPQVVTNAEFTQCLAKALHRIAIFPVPAWLLRGLLGEMSSILLDDNVAPSSDGEYQDADLLTAFKRML